MSAAIVVPTVVEPHVDDKALVLRNSLAVRTPVWDGTTGVLQPRRATVALAGLTAASLGSVVVGTCSSPFAALMGPYPCVAAVVAAVVITVVAAFGTLISSLSGRSSEADDFFTWDYPSIQGGLSSKQRIQQAYDVDFNDGLPVLVGRTSCNDEYHTCHKLWYSKSTYINLQGQNAAYHRVHATPHSHDFRAALKNTTSTLRRRQTDYEEDGSAAEDDGSALYGGYVWEEGTEATLEDIYDEGTSTDIADDIIGEMNTENLASGKYSEEGSYCQDWASSADSAPGSLGYMWYYADTADYPSSEESALLLTCSEESTDPADK